MMLPLLCKVLNLLRTNEKFRVRRVCKKWRSQVDENVSFHTCLCNGNYDEVIRRFGSSRCVTSIWIDDYSKTDIPVHNFTSLKNLTVNGSVHKLALPELLSKATNLPFLRLFVDHGSENTTINVAARAGNSYPALLSIKELYISYSSRNRSSTSERA
ncbi:unnamed protein product [Orchesella dallaii]|uniref:F-box domain-containing protein n=1 Tax=Orchesella dallaii TaxID=48710 RepID=A0ABP1RNK6_9HEXA